MARSYRAIESAKLLAEQLAADRQLAAEAAVEPVIVGKTGWDQAQYMEFWLSVIGGFRLRPGFMAHDVDRLRDKARQECERQKLDLELMTSSQSPEARAAEYFKMSKAFASLVRDGFDATPVPTVVRMIDPDTSLGAQAERAFARQIVGSKVMNISLVQPATPRDLEVVNPRLAADTERLIKFGATVFDTRYNNVRLILTEEEAA